MSKREAIKTTKKQIVDYWLKYVDESDLSIDFSEAEERCWRCGCKRNLERCHIIPYSLGGEDIPSNYVILCKRCHLDNPNVSDPEIMWDWLKAYKVPFYDTFWSIQAMQEYKRIYGKSFKEEYSERNINQEEFQDIFEKQLNKASFHFGDPYLNVATICGLYRMSLKEYDKRHGIETKRNIKPYVSFLDI